MIIDLIEDVPEVFDVDEVEFVGQRRASEDEVVIVEPPKKKPKRRKEKPPAMLRGARAAIALNDVDQTFSNLRAEDRTQLLVALFGLSRSKLDAWRKAHERQGACTLWGLVESCGKAHPETSLRCEVGILPPVLEHAKAGNVTTASALGYMRRRLEAGRASEGFDAGLQAVKDGSDFGCCVCMDDFSARDLVFCAGEAVHAVCRPCFRSLCVQFAADKGVGSSAVACPVPKCGALFSRQDVVNGVSPLDLMKIDERERDASMRVGMGGAATLRCVCGAVAAVDTHHDGRPTVVECPECARAYCAACGNFDHTPDPCPPPKDGTDKWLAKKTKRCPKCKEAIEKNAGCNHMTCRCGHQWCWLCLGNYPNCNCGHFQDESLREAQRLQQDENDQAFSVVVAHALHNHAPHHHLYGHFARRILGPPAAPPHRRHGEGAAPPRRRHPRRSPRRHRQPRS